MARDIQDVRRHPRFPTWIEGTLHHNRSGQWQPVMVTDISLGGAGVQLTEFLVAPEPGDAFILTFEWRLRLCELDCLLVEQSAGETTAQLHVRFREMGWAQSKSLLALIGKLAEADLAS